MKARVDDVFKTLIPRILDEEVIPVLPPTLYNSIVDIIMIQNEEGEWELKIVELNPFAEFASSGLFTWERDWKVLQGILPLEFRFAMKPTPGRLNLPADWMKVVEDANIQI